MGTGLLNWVRKHTSKEQTLAFWMTFCMTLIVHLYKFTNTLPNHDGMYNVYTKQNMIGSGRWALQIACGFSSYYDLPWVTGIISCVFIALAVAVIVKLFHIKNPVLIFLAGGFLVSSPATTETFFFQFTADGYMIAMALAAAGVYLSRIGETRKCRFILSCIMICVCCGIYQAYLSFALILAVCHMIYELLRNEYEKRDYLRWFLRQVLIFGLSLAAYYILWKLSLKVSGIRMFDYQGMSEVGTLNLDTIVNGLKSALNSVKYYFFQLSKDYGWSFYDILNAMMLIGGGFGLILAGIKTKLWQRPWALVLIVLGLVAIVPFAGIWHLTSSDLFYRPMMLQSLMLLYLLTALLFEDWAKDLSKNLVGLLLTVIIFHNAILANICYFHMNLCYERTYADLVDMMGDIRDMRSEGEFTHLAVVGNRFADVQWGFQNEKGELTKEGKFYLLSGLLEQNLLVDADQIGGFLRWYTSEDIPSASYATCQELMTREEVQAMPVWPAEGSLKIIDGNLVLKLSEFDS